MKKNHHHMAYILWLGQTECHNPSLVGNKAANLSKLAAECHVPSGFCITTAAFEQWAADSNVSATISPVSELYRELAVAYHSLSERCGVDTPAVAVRSSGVDEDGVSLSFAGQLETVLNVIGIDAVAAAIGQCWGSIQSPRVLEYRKQQGLSGDNIKIAVLVQQLIEADVSIVAFSANPVTGYNDEIVINANWGLGESIVSGKTTPDTSVVSKPDFVIQSHQVAHKRYITVPSSTGTTEVQVPSEQCTQPALTDEQILEIARLVSELEEKMGWPVDIECAYQNETLYLLQCRPITTNVDLTKLKPDQRQTIDQNRITWDCREDEQFTWVWDKQAFPEPLTPLIQSYLPYHTQGWAKAAREQDAPGSTHIRFEHGYFYSNWRPTGLTTWEAAEAAWEKAEQVTPTRWKQEWLPEIQANLERWGAVDLSALADDALAQHLHEVLTQQIRHWAIHAHMGSAPVNAVGRFVNWYLERFPDAPESEPYRLLQGQPNISVESNHYLWELCNMLTPEIKEILRSAAWTQLPEPFRERFEAYLNIFGHRPQKLVDPASPTWREDPKPVVHLIVSYAESNVPDPHLEMEHLSAEREAFTKEIRNKLSLAEHTSFDSLLDYALANNPLIEEHAFWLDQRTCAALRDICAEFERRLVKNGVLECAEDIAYLTLDELIRWGFGLTNPLRPRIAQRKIEHQNNQYITPPDFLGAPPQPQDWVDRYGGPSVPLKSEPGELRGIGASPGIVQGTARIAHTLQEAFELKKGEILVCASTDPNWTPLFGLAAALVTEAGGSLCHAAVVAREYGIPAVLGTHTATRTIITGQIIEVDGTQGIVRLL